MPVNETENMNEIESLKAKVLDSEMRFRAIFETVVDGVISIDDLGIIFDVNPAVSKMFGYSHDELIGRNVSILTGADYTAKHDGYIQNYLLSGNAKIIGQRREVMARHSSGREFPIDLAVSEMWLAGERRFTGVVRDISYQKLAEREARDAESRLIDAIGVLPDGFALYDENDRLLLFNDRYREIYKQSADFMVPGIQFEDLIRKGLERGQYSDAIGREEEWIAERLHQHRNPSGAVEQLLDNGSWVRIIERVTPNGYTVGFRIDITELKEREISLRKSEELTRKTIDAASDSIIIIDVKGNILDFNPAAEVQFGYRRSDILGKELAYLLVPHKHREKHINGLRRFAESGISDIIGQRIEVPGLRADGSEFIMELSIQVADSDDGPLVIGFARDISEQKAAENALIEAKEQAEAATRAQTNFVAMMSHEIRTPLNGVLGILSLLKDSELDAEQSELVDTGVDSGHGLLRIINDILDYSKFEEGHMELEVVDLNPSSLVKGIVDILSPVAIKKGLKINTKFDGDHSINVKGDTERMRQVLINLAGNALKFTEEGFVTIRTEIGEPVDGRSRLSFYVVDTGIGIPEAKLDEVFERFKTVNPNYQHKDGGTGLGLAISRQIVEAMGGEIGVKSNDLGGSTFWFNVDLEVSQAEIPAKQEAIMPLLAPRKADGSKHRLLMAEDNSTNAMVARAMLERAGYELDVVTDGLQAVKAVQETEYDAVLMDIGMPIMDGTAATAEIRKLPGRAAAIPIIALTAHAMSKEQMAGLTQGMDDYATKPIDKIKLLGIVGKWVAGDSEEQPAKEANDAVVANAAAAEPPVSQLDHSSQSADVEAAAPTPAAVPHAAEDIAAFDRDLLAEEPLLDHSILVQLGEDTDPELVPILIDDFIANARDRYNSIAVAANAKDMDDLKHHAHALCSSAATFGALRLRELVFELEAACMRHDEKKALDLADHIESVGKQTEVTLRNYAKAG